MFLLSLLRMFAFRLHESPRFLIGRGRDAEAVAVVHAIAAYNNVESRLSVEDLEEAAKTVEDRRARICTSGKSSVRAPVGGRNT